MRAADRQNSTLLKIIQGLFLLKSTGGYNLQTYLDVAVIPPVTTKELLEICSRVTEKKGSGLDSIPNKALKLAVKLKPNIFLEMFETRLVDGIFPETWKRQRLVLVSLLVNHSPADLYVFIGRPSTLLN